MAQTSPELEHINMSALRATGKHQCPIHLPRSLFALNYDVVHIYQWTSLNICRGGAGAVTHTTPPAQSYAYFINDSGFKPLHMHQSLMLCTIMNNCVGLVVTPWTTLAALYFEGP